MILKKQRNGVWRKVTDREWIANFVPRNNPKLCMRVVDEGQEYYLINIAEIRNSLLPDELRKPHLHLAEEVLERIIKMPEITEITEELIVQIANEIESKWSKHSEWKKGLDRKRGLAA